MTMLVVVIDELLRTISVHLSNLEPGGVKTNYATSPLKRIAKGHPAYANPSFPANLLLRHIDSESGRAHWAEPGAVARAIVALVSLGRRIPIRVPLGSDAWGMISKDLGLVQEDLDEVKDISVSVSDEKHMGSIRFLHR